MAAQYPWIVLGLSFFTVKNYSRNEANCVTVASKGSTDCSVHKRTNTLRLVCKWPWNCLFSHGRFRPQNRQKSPLQKPSNDNLHACPLWDAAKKCCEVETESVDLLGATPGSLLVVLQLIVQ